MTTPTLAGIGHDLDALYAAIEEQQGEITPEQEASLDALLGAEADKVDAYAWRIKQATVDADALAAQIASIETDVLAVLAAKRRTRVAVADRLKARALAYMQERGETALKGVTWTLASQRNGTRALDVAEEDPEKWPAGLVRVTTAIDRAAVQRTLRESGAETVMSEDGTVLARLAPAGTHLRVR